MKLERLKSKVIHSAGYDPTTRTLRLKFHTGRMYDYSDVSPEEHASLLCCESKGAFFSSRIRGKKTHCECKDEG